MNSEKSKLSNIVDHFFFQVWSYFILSLSQGHIHITDFNIATILKEGYVATSLSGTKAYMGMFTVFILML